MAPLFSGEKKTNAMDLEKGKQGLVRKEHTGKLNDRGHCILPSVKEHHCTKICNINDLGSSLEKETKWFYSF